MLRILLLFSLISLSAQASDYSDAENHAKDAFLVQSGLSTLISKTGDYFKKQYVSPYPLLDTTGVIGYSAYYAYKHHAFPIKLTKDCKLTLSTSSLGIEYHW